MNILNINRELNELEMKIAYFARFFLLALAVLLFGVGIFRFVVPQNSWDVECMPCIWFGLAHFFSFLRYTHMLKKYKPLTTYHIKLFMCRFGRYGIIPIFICEWDGTFEMFKSYEIYVLIFFFVLTIVCEIATVRRRLKIQQLKEQIKQNPEGFMNTFEVDRELNESEMKIASFARFFILALAVSLLVFGILRISDTQGFMFIVGGLLYFHSFFRCSRMLRRSKPLTTAHIKISILHVCRLAFLPLFIYALSCNSIVDMAISIFLFLFTIIAEVVFIRMHFKIKQLKEQIKKLNEKK